MTKPSAEAARRRRAVKPPAAEKRTPQLGSRYPSGVLGVNVRRLRLARDMRQVDLAERMRWQGFDGWSRVSVSDTERGIRSTGVDELFALAVALECSVVHLLDPVAAGGGGIDLNIREERGAAGVTFSPANPEAARRLLTTEEDPWAPEPGIGFTWKDNRIVGFYFHAAPRWMQEAHAQSEGVDDEG